MDVWLSVNPYDDEHASGYQYDTITHSFLYGGLVFTPVSFDYLRAVGGDTSDPARGRMYEELLSALRRPWQSGA